ncbi:Oxysterol-binding protein-related protein 1A [Coccomyxa sp. Obi]|nr:Oxysterol-binding protein-related protein 1A [Coccomyxa sp. Obi]
MASPAAWWEAELPAPERRTALPHAKLKLPSAQETWNIVKHMVSSNSMDVPIPVHMCMPIDELQRRAEEMEYSELLDQAAEEAKGSIERLLLVAAFALSAFQSARPMRASLPIMGETVEVVLPEKKMRFLTETVYLNQKANRVINAWVAEGQQWMLEGEDEPTLKFRGPSLELHMNWLEHLTFSDGDAYTWKKMTTGAAVIHVMGKSSITFKGTVVVEQVGGRLSAHLALKEDGMIRSLASRKPSKHKARSSFTLHTECPGFALNAVVGHIEKDGVRLHRPVIRGHWDAELVADLADGSQKTLFRINPPPAEPDRCNLPLFSARLNEMTPGLEAKLPPTDVRRRWDLRALERGDYAQAAAGKEMLERRWRQRERKHCERTGDTSLPPRWFQLREGADLMKPHGKTLRFRYKGGYWEARAARNWQGTEDIFAPEDAS